MLNKLAIASVFAGLFLAEVASAKQFETPNIDRSKHEYCTRQVAVSNARKEGKSEVKQVGQACVASAMNGRSVAEIVRERTGREGGSMNAGSTGGMYSSSKAAKDGF